MIGYNKIFIQAGSTSSQRGWGDLVRSCNAAGIPVGCAASDVTPPDVQGNILNRGNFIATEDEHGRRFDFDYTVYPDNKTAHDAWQKNAARRWALFKQRIPTDLDPTICALSIENEQRGYLGWGQQGSDDWTDEIPGFTGWADCEGWQAYFTALEVLKDTAYQYFAFAFSGGNPEYGCWKQPGMAAYLLLCQMHPDRLGVALHEYSFNDNLFHGVQWGDTPQDAIGDKVFRFRHLFDACDQLAIARPRVQIKEFGYHERRLNGGDLGYVKGQLLSAAEVYAHYPEIELAALWTTQRGWGDASQQTEALIPWLNQMTLDVSWQIDDPEPPSKPKIVIFKYAQEHSRAAVLEIAGVAFNEYKRTLTGSHHDAITMIKAGNADSYAVIWDAHFPSQQETIKAFEDVMLAEDIALAYEIRTLSKSPLDGLELGYLFGVPYVMTSPFGVDREYGKHEGTDYDILTSDPDSNERVLCVRDGIVDRAMYSRKGYGQYVRVLHENNGAEFYTRYAHLDRMFVQVGDAIKAGEPVGEIGATGNASGEHIHINLEVPGFGLDGYEVADVVDPAPYLPGNGGIITPPSPVVDMTPYFLVPDGFGDIFTLTNNWGEGPERVQLQSEGNISYITKNRQYEQRIIDADKIRFVLDTSPGEGMYYTVRSTTGWMPRFWRVNETFNRSEHTRFYRKSDCVQTHEIIWSQDLRFMALHDRWTSPGTDITLDNVIEIHWIVNGHADEIYYFAPGLGLLAWEKPFEGRASHITELIPRGHQENNVRETGCFD